MPTLLADQDGATLGWVGAVAGVLAALGVFVPKVLDAIAKYRRDRAILTSEERDAAAKSRRMNSDAQHEREQLQQVQFSANQQRIIDDQRAQLLEQRQLLMSQQQDLTKYLQSLSKSETERTRCEADMRMLAYTLQRVRSGIKDGDPGTINEAIIITDQDLTIRDVNQATVIMTHYPREQLIGLNAEALIPLGRRQEHHAKVAALLAEDPDIYQDHPLMVEVLTKDGHEIPAFAIISSWKDAETGKRFFGVAIQRRAEVKLEDAIPRLLKE